MKVLLQKNIQNVGKIGDIVEVKAGYARNYLLPQGLAVHPSAVNLRAVEAAKQAYLEELAKIRTELEAKAAVVDGREVAISARANEEGHLYGSIGPAQISAALAERNVFVDAAYVALAEPVRQLGEYDVAVKFADDLSATVRLKVLRLGEDQDDGQGPASTEPDQPASTDDQPQ